MSENREPEMMEQEKNGQEHEPIESIEQTVADLKKKIEELTEEQEQARETQQKDTGDKIAAFTESAKEIVSASIDEIKAKAEDLSDNADLCKTIAYIKEQALVYDSYNAASEAQCALRALENAGQLARNLSSDKGDLSGSTL